MVQRLRQIREDVPNVLCADGQTDGGGCDALLRFLCIRKLRVGCTGGVFDEAFYIGPVGEEGGELEQVDERILLGLPSL